MSDTHSDTIKATICDTLSKNLLALHEERQVDAADIEKATSIPAADYMHYKLGERMPDLADFMKIAQYFNIQPQQLLAGLPNLLNYVSPDAGKAALNEAEAAELQHNFLQQDGPNRGGKFKSLVDKISKIDRSVCSL